MDVEKAFHMTGGLGNTSYAQNSSLQKRAADMVKHITLETLREAYSELAPCSIGIADLGCSSTPNTLSTIKDIVEAVEGASKATSSEILGPAPEFRVYLNDLPTNDFNTVFKALPDFQRELKEARNGATSSIYIAGCPGSFYGRVFPNNCLHFIHSSYSLHWLSKVPPGLYDEQGKSRNKGTVYISKSSPPGVPQAYMEQFQEDFSMFLQSRSEELVLGGRMVLIMLGRRGPDHVDRGNSFFWELLARSLSVLVSKGLVEQEKLDSYDVHFYAPSKEEIEEAVRKEGSFVLDQLEVFEAQGGDAKEGESYGTVVAMTVRAIQESMIRNHFGEGILDILFEIYGKIVDEELGIGDIKPIAFALVLRKIQ